MSSSSSSSSSFSSVAERILSQRKAYEKEQNEKWKEFIFYQSNSCTICLKELKDGEGTNFKCEFAHRQDRLCQDCVKEKDYYMTQIIDFHDGNRPVSSTFEMEEQMSLGAREDYYLNTRTGVCTTCSAEYSWLVFMNMNGKSNERCQACTISFPRHYLRVYKATEVCSNYTNGYRDEEEPQWRSDRRFHLLCMECCKAMKETKKELDKRENEEKKDNQCTACKHSELMVSMNCQIAFTGDKLEFLDAIPAMRIVAESQQKIVYSACEGCNKSKCDVNISHTFDIECKMCITPFGDEYGKYKNTHLLCTDCAGKYTPGEKSLESLHTESN